ncbi:MAG: sulfite exporter TauE/SafE family protein, partial [Lysobacterales bacterium]
RFISMAWLALFFAVFVGYSGLNMLKNKKPKASRQLPGVAGRTAVGTGIGFISGLVGAGGGFLSVPFMVWCNVPIRNAVATSAACGLLIALASAVVYGLSPRAQSMALPEFMLGYVFWPGALAIAATSVLTAPYGAAMAHRLSPIRLRRIFAGFLLLIAMMMSLAAVRGG